MTKDEIIRMAREAGLHAPEGRTYILSPTIHPDDDLSEYLERFAALIASAEREACADVCISLANRWSQMGAWGSNTEFHQCAEAIRARGQA